MYRDLDQHFMRKAMQEAMMAFEKDEVPIGAVVVLNHEIIGRGYNQVEQLKDPTAHAEILAITAACQTIGAKYLEGCDIFVTLEPCIMCAGAIIWSRAKRLVFSCPDSKKGFLTASTHIDKALIQQLDITYPMMEEQSAGLLKEFFQSKRKS